MATVKENLIAAKALIDTPEKWAKGPGSWGYDRNCADQALFHLGYRATKAISSSIPFGHKFRQRIKGKWSVLDSANIIRFNDHPYTTHADIMALFDRAIDAAE